MCFKLCTYIQHIFTHTKINYLNNKEQKLKLKFKTENVYFNI